MVSCFLEIIAQRLFNSLSTTGSCGFSVMSLLQYVFMAVRSSMYRLVNSSDFLYSMCNWTTVEFVHPVV